MIKVGKVVGINTDQQAALASSTGSEGDSYFLAILSLVCDDAFTRGRQLLSEISDAYFDASEGSAKGLTEAAEALKSKLSDTESYSFLLGGFSGKALYLIGKGEVVAKLQRSGGVSPLDLSSGQLVSGFLQEGDRVILATVTMVEFLGGEFTPSLDLSLVDWEEEIREKLKVEDAPVQAGLVLEFGEKVPKEDLPAGRQGLAGATLPETASRSNPIGKIFSKVHLNPLKIFRLLPRSGRGRFILALILILSLGLGIGYQYKSGRDREQARQFEELFLSAKGDFDAAKGLANLDPSASKAKLASAKDSLNKALALKPNETAAKELKAQIETEEAGILQQFEVPKLPEFLDLTLIKDGFKAEHLSLSVNKLLLLDKDTGSLVSVDLKTKSNQVLAGKDALGKAEKASVNGDNAFVYSDKGVVKVSIADKKASVVTKKDSEWGTIVDLAGFASNVYLLDTGNPPTGGQIWKYLATSSGFSDKREYLEKDVKADFNNAIRMQIDSSIYVLKSGGDIVRFTKGAADNFALGGLDKNIKDPKSIFVSSDTDNFYILDSGNERLVVTTKTGAYKAQYQAAEFGTASDLVVDEKAKKVYLLDNNKIFQMELK